MISRIQIEMLSIENEGYHLFINGKVNGKQCRLLIDTGASRTVFDLEKLKAITGKKEFEKNEKLSTGLGASTLESYVGWLDEFTLGDYTIKNYMVVALDLSHLNESYGKLGLPEIDGVLGSELLYEIKAIINYKELVMAFEIPEYPNA